MRKTLDVQIREQVGQFLDRRITLSQFNKWLGLHTWNVHRTGNEAAQRLTFEIERLLAEFDNGDLTEDELRAQLRELGSYVTPKGAIHRVLGSRLRRIKFAETPKIYLVYPVRPLLVWESGSGWSAAA